MSDRIFAAPMSATDTDAGDWVGDADARQRGSEEYVRADIYEDALAERDAEIERLEETNRSNQILATEHFKRANKAEAEIETLRGEARQWRSVCEKAERELAEAREEKESPTPLCPGCKSVMVCTRCTCEAFGAAREGGEG